MNENVARVMNGYRNLSDEDKSAFIDELNKYNKSNYFEKANLNESIIRKSSVGPKNSVCGCCGR